MRLYLINPSNPLVTLAKVKESRWNRYRVWKPLARHDLLVGRYAFGAIQTTRVPASGGRVHVRFRGSQGRREERANNLA